MFLRSVACVPMAAAVTLLVGCGDHRLEVVPVTGKVTCGGKPLTSGAVTFTPIVEDGSALEARPALGVIQSDGTFTLTTYEQGDGALVGKHRVSFLAPTPGEEGEGDDEGAAPPPEPLPQDHPCRFGGVMLEDVEVVDGENNLTIELSPVRPGREIDDDSD